MSNFSLKIFYISQEYRYQKNGHWFNVKEGLVHLPLSSRLHNESENSVAGPTDSKTSDQLVTERLSLQKTKMIVTEFIQMFDKLNISKESPD